MPAWLEYKGTKRPIHGTLSVGRLPENDLPLEDAKVSRRHALFYESAGGCWVVDLGSRNGVFLNGHPLRQPSVLSAGDEILVGDCRLKFHTDTATPPRANVATTARFAPTADARSVFAANGNSVVLLNAEGKVLSETPQAREWLKDYYGAAAESQLPARVTSWFNRARRVAPLDAAEPLVKQIQEKRLVLRLGQAGGDQWLLLMCEELPAYSVGMLESLGLTAREAEVMHWVAEGKTNSDIADLLGISVSTVNKHMENILGKLGVENRTQAMLRVLEKLGRG